MPYGRKALHFKHAVNPRSGCSKSANFANKGHNMNVWRFLLLPAGLLILGALSADVPAGPKQPKPDAMLIEVRDLQKSLKEPGLRILDTRPQADYAKGHIP